ncbi:hypothetical protein CKM354_000524000 [Cercospora kikuchii]|uniref:Uncharacterized protein n=1 Tax=Cercospora kikuchii TaxID=84275 RepID=A0A9P3FFD2_9PEZI|nr:uncharacterized protein CKM354_000524000 [Cercospora kikuchii]GIZ41957.1 hypothetical protein CKM354_000524000 [Cercospora kikuchii]
MRSPLCKAAALLTFIFATPIAADFFVSNTSVCMGAFPLKRCARGPKVLSNISNTTKEAPYTCSHLIHAEDNNYIHNGTMAPFTGDLFVSSAAGICGSGQLDFVKVGNDGGYTVNDKDGAHVGDCVPEKNITKPEWEVRCNQWVGMLFFATAFKCTSSVCG